MKLLHADELRDQMSSHLRIAGVLAFVLAAREWAGSSALAGLDPAPLLALAAGAIALVGAGLRDFRRRGPVGREDHGLRLRTF